MRWLTEYFEQGIEILEISINDSKNFMWPVIVRDAS